MHRKIHWTILICKNAGLLLFLLIFLSNGVFAQTDTIGFNKNYIKKCLADSKSVATAPFHWNKKNWVGFGVVTSSIAATLLVDKKVADFSQEHRTRGLDRFSANFLEPFDKEYSFMLMGGFLAHGLLTDNKKSVSTGLLLLESYSLAMLFVRIPKNLAGRKRPDAWPSSVPTDWEGPFQGASFPSGHTAASFAVASVIANQYREQKWVPVTAYTIASMVGLSRIYDNKHWLSDVVAGAVIGTVIGNLVSRRLPNNRLSITPCGNSRFQGVNLAYTFK